MKYPAHLSKVIEILKKLPGVGTRSAERFAFHLLDWSERELKGMAEAIHLIPEKLKHCSQCGCLMDQEKCGFCEDTTRSAVLCIIAFPKDVFAIEATREYRGFYYVLGSLLSPMDGFGPEKLNLAQLKKHLVAKKIEELVIALDSTLEGDTTALFLKQELELLNIPISRLAFGLPMGSSLDYVDGGTLARALIGRRQF